MLRSLDFQKHGFLEDPVRRNPVPVNESPFEAIPETSCRSPWLRPPTAFEFQVYLGKKEIFQM